MWYVSCVRIRVWSYLALMMSACLHVCVVFFKQKTAYEMRISDWSSDVCSSDLLGCVESDHLSERQFHQYRGHDGIGCDRRSRAFRSREQIGRASCRERVCQYV